MPPSSLPSNRSFGLQGAGKGDSDRSPGWRDNYPEINWPGVDGLEEKSAGRFIKYYGPSKSTAEEAAV